MSSRDDDLVLERLRGADPLGSVAGEREGPAAPEGLLNAIVSGELQVRRNVITRRVRLAHRERPGAPGDLVMALRGVNPVSPERVATLAAATDLDALVDAIVTTPSPARLPVRVFKRSLATAFRPIGDDDLVAVLRGANPYRAESVAEEADGFRAANLLEEILGGRRARRPWSRTRKILVPILVAAAIGGTAAGFILTEQQPSYAEQFACYSADSLTSSFVLDLHVGSSAVAACESQWTAGKFGAPSSQPLVACVLSTGAIGVFPGTGDEVCAELHLAAALAPTNTASAVEAFGVAVSHDLSTETCVGLPAAEQLVQNELAKYGLTGWSVQVNVPPTPALPCILPIVHIASTVVSLIAAPRSGP